MFDINHLIINTFNPIGHGVLAHNQSRGKLFSANWGIFLTHGTIVDQYIVKWIHKYSCRKKINNILKVITIFLSKTKFSQNFKGKFQKEFSY